MLKYPYVTQLRFFLRSSSIFWPWMYRTIFHGINMLYLVCPQCIHLSFNKYILFVGELGLPQCMWFLRFFSHSIIQKGSKWMSTWSTRSVKSQVPWIYQSRDWSFSVLSHLKEAIVKRFLSLPGFLNFLSSFLDWILCFAIPQLLWTNQNPSSKSFFLALISFN